MNVKDDTIARGNYRGYPFEIFFKIYGEQDRYLKVRLPTELFMHNFSIGLSCNRFSDDEYGGELPSSKITLPSRRIYRDETPEEISEHADDMIRQTMAVLDETIFNPPIGELKRIMAECEVELKNIKQSNDDFKRKVGIEVRDEE